MWRLIKLVLHGGLVMVAAVAGFAVVDGASIPNASFLPAATGVVAGAVGLLAGFCIAWARRQPWHMFPAIVRAWLARAARQLGWAMVSCLSLAVLIFY